MKTFLRPCATGLLLLAPLAAATTTLPVQEPKEAAAQELPAARTIIDRYLKLIEYDKGLKNVRSYEVVGTVEVAGMGITGGYRLKRARPDRILMEVTLEGIGDVKTGFDGTTFWTIHPMMGAMVAEGRELAQNRVLLQFAREEYSPKLFEKTETAELTKFEGREAYRVRLVLKPFEGLDEPEEKTLALREMDDFFDVETGRLLGSKSTRATVMGPMPVKVIYGELKQYGGIWLPSGSREILPTAELVTTVDEVVAGTVEPDAFKVPDEIQVVIDRQKSKEKEGAGAGAPGR